MLSKLFEAIYHKVLINIVVERARTIVYVEVCSKKEVVSRVEKEFSTTILDSEMYDFINFFMKESPYYYISILDTSASQGAIPTCSKHKFAQYADLTIAEYKCHKNEWAYYTSKNDMIAMQKEYAAIGLDYIFSPFSLLAHFFNDKINNNLAMYILVQDSFLSVGVFEKSELLYAHHLDMMTKDELDDMSLNEDLENSDLLLDDELSIELDDIEVANEFEDFANIEDLDAIEEIDEFSDNKDIEEELLESDESLAPANDTEFNEDYQRFSLIQASVGQFYKDNMYESRFIENVYVADCVGVTSDFKKYLEEEMFFNVYVRHAEIAPEVCELAKMELDI
ncbi:hypothetical protein [Sulfurimonas sp.]